MHCNGKCQMMKKWKEEEKKEQEKSARKLNVQDEVLSSRSFFTQITGISGRTVSRLPQYASPLPDNLPRLVFHPPGC